MLLCNCLQSMNSSRCFSRLNAYLYTPEIDLKCMALLTNNKSKYFQDCLPLLLE